jgi:FHA domain-containing protein
MIGCSPQRLPRRVLSLAVSALFALSLAGSGQAQSPSATPPGSGGTVVGNVRVLTGNDLARNTGQENQPPIWATVDSKGSSAVVTIGNATRTRIDFGGAGVTIMPAPGVGVTKVLVSTGSAAIQGNQVIWNGFSLNSGQIVPAIVELSSTTPAASADAASIREISIDARETGSGGRVTESVAGGGPPLTALETGQVGTAANPAPPGDAPLSQRAARSYLSWTMGLLGAVLLALVVLATGLLVIARRIRVAALDARFTTIQSGIEELESAVAVLSASIGRGGPVTANEPQATDPSRDIPIAELEIVEGAEPGRRWQLTGETMSIGRDPQNSIVLADPRVSAAHARLSLQTGGRYLLADSGSTNGTTVNNRLLTEPELLKDGDRIHIGGTTFVYRDVSRAL